MDVTSPTGLGANGALSPTTPLSVKSLTGTHGGAKRKRSFGAGMGSYESSPESGGVDDDLLDHNGKKRMPGVKRACNECRQQKLRCDVVQEPFSSCSRCIRLKLVCKIESNFKRVGKRSKHAEMEKEIDRLRRNVAQARTQGYVMDEEEEGTQSHLQSPVVNSVYTHTRNSSLMGSDEAVSSLIHLKQGGAYNVPRIAQELEGIQITEEAESQLFHDYFAHYHQFLPFLNLHHTPAQYYSNHPLLYWSIVAVAARRFERDRHLLTSLALPLTKLLWQTTGDVPASYQVVKALCLLCTWPLPTSTTSSDPTHILCGVMMKTATGIGLHRPNHMNDFSRVPIELDRDQIHDRVSTWAVCNIVAQSIGTGYGQPASTLYDWTLTTRPGISGPFTLSPDLEARLQIERFCDKVSKEMYSNASDPRGVAGDEHRAMLMRVYRREYGELHAAISSRNLSNIVNVYLKAAGLHLRLAGFFDSSTTPGYVDDLTGLWRATVSFLDYLLDSDRASSSPRLGGGGALATVGGGLLKYASNYILQMLVAAGFALLKMMRSFFVKYIDFERGRTLFHRTVEAIRTASVLTTDLNARLAELMVQMWNGARMDAHSKAFHDEDALGQVDDSLQLRVRCRHSMSLVFDSIWHWREEYQARGRGTLDGKPTESLRDISVQPAESYSTALRHPTHPDSAAESSASSTHLDAPLAQHNTMLSGNSAIGAGLPGSLTPNGGNGVGTTSNTLMNANFEYGNNNNNNMDFFDPQNWMLDGLVDFNYSFVPEMGA